MVLVNCSPCFSEINQLVEGNLISSLVRVRFHFTMFYAYLAVGFLMPSRFKQCLNYD